MNRRGKPVQLLPLVEHDLQRPDAQDEQRHAEVIDSHSSAPQTRLPGGVFDQAKNHQERRDTRPAY